MEFTGSRNSGTAKKKTPTGARTSSANGRLCPKPGISPGLAICLRSARSIQLCTKLAAQSSQNRRPVKFIYFMLIIRHSYSEMHAPPRNSADPGKRWSILKTPETRDSARILKPIKTLNKWVTRLPNRCRKEALTTFFTCAMVRRIDSCVSLELTCVILALGRVRVSDGGLSHDN